MVVMSSAEQANKCEASRSPPTGISQLENLGLPNRTTRSHSKSQGDPDAPRLANRTFAEPKRRTPFIVEKWIREKLLSGQHS